MNILVIGAGAWGTALALAAAPRHAVTLWARDEAQAADMHRQRVNARYLPGVPLPDNLSIVSGDLGPHAASQDLIVIATPMAALRSTLAALAELGITAPVVWLCKGFETAQSDGTPGLLGHE
ncbi:MAG: glycerol-3-phosphate dehydrogenase, partial [Burkholderiaceae bacterium]|nr:glycerol-3-phosphate dehydrogenase [Burkholderiaceae bacterium]